MRTPRDPDRVAGWQRLVRRIAVAVLCWGFVACVSPSQQTSFMRNRPEVVVVASTAEMRLRTVAFARRASGLIEESASQIEEESSDPEVRRAALLWKLRAIPLIHQTALQPDPLIAAADLWVLSLQMKAFFSAGEGKDVFGVHQPIAIATCAENAATGEAVVIAAVRGQNIDAAREAIERFARENPIRNAHLHRESISIAFADELFSDDKSTFETVGDVEHTARDIDYRLGFMSEYLLKQASWTVELALLDASDEVDVDAATTELREAMEHLRELLDALPALIAQQRDDLLAALAGEREATLASIDAQRVDTLEALSREREAVFAGIGAQREEIRALLTAEREAAMEDLEGAIERSLEGVVDHAMWRLVQLGFVGAILVLPIWWMRSRASASA